MKRLATLIMAIGILTLIITSVMDSGEKTALQTQSPNLNGPTQKKTESETTVSTPQPEHDPAPAPGSGEPAENRKNEMSKEEIALEQEIKSLLEDPGTGDLGSHPSSDSYHASIPSADNPTSRKYTKEDEWELTAKALENLDDMDSMTNY